MKILVYYRTCRQVSPDGYEDTTKMKTFEHYVTLSDVREWVLSEMKLKPGDKMPEISMQEID